MKKDNYYWMQYAIKLANEINTKSIRVSAVLVNDNKLVDTSCNNNERSWAEDLIIKLNNKKINKIENLYLTINTLNNDQEFDLNILLSKIEVANIFLGLPDPNLDDYLKNDPILTNKNIFRFTEDLQEEIFKQNYNFYKNSKQNIKYSKYYHNNRISQFIKKKLDSYGINLETDDILQKKPIEKLSGYISSEFNITKKKAYELITTILSEAFDYKYSKYDYSNDIRSINPGWNKIFEEIYIKTNKKPLNKTKILNVGVGSGNEAKELFLNCNDITFVDIASNGLEKIKKLIPTSKIIKGRAEDLSMLEDNSYDLYVSLRTYNSSFFDIKQAIKEAYRILKHDCVIIISISNGFLNSKEKKLIPGIIIPKLNFVDLYRGLDIIKNLSTLLLDFNFEYIELTPTNGELYLSARVNKK